MPLCLVYVSGMLRAALRHVRPRGTVVRRGWPTLNVAFDVECELERANTFGAFLSMDEYSPDAFVASQELLTKRGHAYITTSHFLKLVLFRTVFCQCIGGAGSTTRQKHSRDAPRATLGTYLLPRPLSRPLDSMR
jgi:hypothetical protein